MAANWSDNDFKALISVWGDSQIQKQLAGTKKNHAVYLKISRMLAEKFGLEYTANQCRSKIKNMLQGYKDIKDNNKKSGRGRQTSRMFELIDAIHSKRANINPPEV